MNFAFPKAKWKQPPVSKTMKAEIPEASLQIFADEYYAIKRIRSIRIPDGIFRWVKMNASPGIQKWFFGTFGGRCDNLLFFPTGKGFSIAFHVELKTTIGKLHGKQKGNLKEEEWIICRNQQDIIDTVEKAEKIVKKLTSTL